MDSDFHGDALFLIAERPSAPLTEPFFALLMMFFEKCSQLCFLASV
jgi:hypothetical protein